MQGVLNFSRKVSNSSWVKEVKYNGYDLTVITKRKGLRPGRSFDLLDVSEAEAYPVLTAVREGGSVGTALQPLIRARDNKGRKK